MINLKEFLYILVISIILGFTISLVRSLESFLYALLSIFVVILISILAKKITAFFIDTEIEIKLWEVKRWGVKAHHYLKKPVPIGALFPLLVTILSFGYLQWMASLVFEVKGQVYKAARRWGLYSFSEVTEYHTGLIAAFGVIANLIFAIIGYLVGFEEFAKLSIYFAFFSILPFSNLDGNKIFFGSIVLWSFLTILTLIALGYAIFIV